jgi:NAD(P)-dependent dehydrogenase (short-subunit alcohol dehydrogenase family)
MPKRQSTGSKRRDAECLLLPGDIREPAWCRTLVEQTMEAFNRLHVLVNNAAAQTTNEDLGDITVDDLEGAFRANVFAQIWLAQAAVPHMRPGACITKGSSSSCNSPHLASALFPARPLNSTSAASQRTRARPRRQAATCS